MRQDVSSQKGKRVFVGMSGGVDSSVSAALLQKAGYEVTGVFIKVWQPEWLTCTWREDRRDAMRVAARLGISFVTLDLEKEYKEEVVDYMIAEYKAGRTPNPDVMCNRYVKFGGFFEWAMRQGADYVATGHYAHIRQKSEIRNSKQIRNRKSEIENVEECHELIVSKDVNKDQTYFLWTLTQEQLAKTLFPVGGMDKTEVRKLAASFKLPTAEKKDSQGLCFIGKIDVKEFLSHYIPAKKGDVLDAAGQVIGTHEGACFYTIGERHGFTITKKTPQDEPVYVITKNIEANTITVASRDAHDELPGARTIVRLRDVNWNQGQLILSRDLKARTRYRAPLQDVRGVSQDTIEFRTPQSTISPGQSLVVYDGDVCLGGGIIV